MRFIYVNIFTIIALSGQITQIQDVLISSKMNGVSIKIGLMMYLTHLKSLDGLMNLHHGIT